LHSGATLLVSWRRALKVNARVVLIARHLRKKDSAINDRLKVAGFRPAPE
jgi:hypothetical protein